MNFGIKIAAFLGAGASFGNTAVATKLGPKAKVVGLFCFNPLGAGNESAVALNLSAGGVDYPLVQVSADAAQTARGKWLGISSTAADVALSFFGAAIAINSARGQCPLALPNQIVDSITGIPFVTSLAVANQGLGGCLVFYTEEDPSPQGMHAG